MAIEYYADRDIVNDPFRVVYLVKKNKTTLIRGFKSPYTARQFVKKLERSKACVFLMSEGFY